MIEKRVNSESAGRRTAVEDDRPLKRVLKGRPGPARTLGGKNFGETGGKVASEEQNLGRKAGRRGGRSSEGAQASGGDIR